MSLESPGNGESVLTPQSFVPAHYFLRMDILAGHSRTYGNNEHKEFRLITQSKIFLLKPIDVSAYGTNMDKAVHLIKKDYYRRGDPILGKWDETADVLVIGYGGAGAVTAITAADAGAKVCILEKSAADAPGKINWTPNTRLSSGGVFLPKDFHDAVHYMEAMIRASGERLDGHQKAIVRRFAEYLTEGKDWIKRICGAEVTEVPAAAAAEHPELPGSACASVFLVKPFEVAGVTYSSGIALMEILCRAVENRKVQVLWKTPAQRLIQHSKTREILGVAAVKNGRDYVVKARKAVVLACGGFEFNEDMKQNYGRAYPIEFTGNAGNTGDGIKMAQDVGAALWHMNAYSASVVAKFPDFPVSFWCSHGIGVGSGGEMLIDRFGNRFTALPFRSHSLFYELIHYNTRLKIYPKIPCYYLFDHKRIRRPLASGFSGASGVITRLGQGPNVYAWSKDNHEEIQKGWILKADTIQKLVDQIRLKFNERHLQAATVEANIKEYNEFCAKGIDLKFYQPKKGLVAFDTPPYYAVQMNPGGVNTNGGPKRDHECRVLDPWDHPIPRLYSAGELGSWWGMLYQSGGNIGECIASGRIAGENAVALEAWESL